MPSTCGRGHAHAHPHAVHDAPDSHQRRIPESDKFVEKSAPRISVWEERRSVRHAIRKRSSEGHGYAEYAYLENTCECRVTQRLRQALPQRFTRPVCMRTCTGVCIRVNQTRAVENTRKRLAREKTFTRGGYIGHMKRHTSVERETPEQSGKPPAGCLVAHTPGVARQPEVAAHSMLAQAGGGLLHQPLQQTHPHTHTRSRKLSLSHLGLPDSLR